MKIKVFDIEWDADDPKDVENLPKSVVINSENEFVKLIDYDELSELISEYITQVMEFTHKGFCWEFDINSIIEEQKPDIEDLKPKQKIKVLKKYYNDIIKKIIEARDKELAEITENVKNE